MPSITTEAFVGRRHAIERTLICAMAGQFPVLTREPTGRLACVFRTGAGHYGLHGTLATATSDDGRTWTDPIEVAPRGDDVRNPAFGVDPTGRWVLLYWQAGVHCYPERRWRLPTSATTTPDCFAITSDDRGRTWSPPAPVRTQGLAWASPFGRIIATDGSLLAAAYGPAHPGAPFDAIVLRSRDGGATWGDESLVVADASELSLCATATHLLGAVRRPDHTTALVTSTDGGRTWSAPRPITQPLEHPADLCALRDGRILLTFGRRRRPLGCGALTSTDGGLTWNRDRELLLAADGIGNDVGYPSTVQLDDDTLVTALYFARGSAASEPADGWGETSCQALRYSPTIL